MYNTVMDKPTLKFSLTVSQQYEDGFRLNVTASGEREIKIAQDLTNRLIEKITKIEISLGQSEDRN